MRGDQLILTLLVCALGSLTGLAYVHPAEAPKTHSQESADQEGAPFLIVERQGDRLSVRIRNTPWAAVLKELERQTGIPIQVEGSLAGTLTQAFEDLPLEQGLRRLFRNINRVFFYEPGRRTDTAAGPLTRVWLFPRNGSGADAAEREAPLRSAGTSTEALPSAEGVKPEEEPAAQSGQGERRSALQALAEQGKVEALQQAVFDADPTLQAAAFELLAARDRPGAIAFLHRMAQSDQPAIRLRVLQLLHETNQDDRETVLAALGEALTDQDATVKSYAIQALAEQGGPDALSYLGQASRDPDPAVRMLVLESIVQMDDGLILLQASP
jgi:hypothetical protein